MKNYLNIFWCLNFVLVCIITLGGFVQAILTDTFIFDFNLPIITLGAFILFVFCFIISISNEKLLFQILPFIFLAFPTVVNNIFPGVYLENSESGAIFPLFTHVDLFIILILWARYAHIGKLILKMNNWWVNISVFLFLLSTVVNFFYCKDSQQIVLLSAGIYPVRFFILIQLLCSNYNIKYDEIVKGFIFCVCFLFVEAFCSSIVFSNETLSSASLGTNTFGNIIGQIVILIYFYIYVYRKDVNNKLIYFAGILLGIITVLLTETRMAILAMSFVFIFIILPKIRLKTRVLLFFLFALTCFISIRFLDIQKFDMSQLLDSISFSRGNNLFEMINIDRGASTNSLITRLQLYQTSLNMLTDNLFTGIGFGLFNVLKYKYGFGEYVIIDSHNGYLFLLSQLGIIGILWIWFIYLYPVYVFSMTKKIEVKQICILNVGMAICDLSNAGIFKISVLSILLFNTIYLMNLRNKY